MIVFVLNLHFLMAIESIIKIFHNKTPFDTCMSILTAMNDIQ